MSGRPFFNMRMLVGIMVLGIMGMVLGCAYYQNYSRAKMLYEEGLQAHFRQGDSIIASSKFEEAASLYLQIDNKAMAGDALGRSAHRYRSLGNIQKALDNANKALALELQVSDNDKFIGRAYMTLASLYGSLNEFDKSNEFYMKGLNKFLPMKYRWNFGDGQGATWSCAETYQALGWTQHHLKKPALALDYHLKAREIYGFIHLEVIKSSPTWWPTNVDTYSNMASINAAIAGDYLKLGDLQNAKNFYDEALTYSYATRNKTVTLSIYLGMGDYHFKKNDLMMP